MSTITFLPHTQQTTTYQMLPAWENPAQYIQALFTALRSGLHPNQLIAGTSLLEQLFRYVGERRFDQQIEQLFSLIVELKNRGADFTLMIDEIEEGIPCIDFSCKQIVFIYWEQLAKEGHPLAQRAWDLFAQVGPISSVEDCLMVNYFEGAAALLRQNRPDPTPLMEQVFRYLASAVYEGRLHAFPDLVLALLECRGDPNLPFEEIAIHNLGTYRNPTCLHVAYLYWRSLRTWGMAAEARAMKEAFLHLLRDPRADLEATFTELDLGYLQGGHFSNYYEYEGDYIEDGNLAHYALVMGDLSTFYKVLQRARHLVGSTCVTTSSKWLLDKAAREPNLCDLEFDHFNPRGRPIDQALIEELKNSNRHGQIVRIHWDKESMQGWSEHVTEVIRRTGVSLCHIAARRLHLEACTFLTANGGNGGIPDSERQGVLDYARLYRQDHTANWTPKIDKQARRVFRALQRAQPLPPQMPTAFYTLHQEGYDVIYNAASKCPIVREVLYQRVLQRTVSNTLHKGYRQNPAIPKLNRAAVTDFKGQPGVILGHAKPRADALNSPQALYDVGYLTNMMAQDPVLNNGLWKKLEEYVRGLVNQHICLHVYTGGVFTTPIDTVGPKTITYRATGANEVSRPTHLYKAVYLFDYGIGWQTLAFLIPNEPLTYQNPLAPCQVPITRIQQLSGVDFLSFYQA